MKRINILKILLIALVFIFPVIANAEEKVNVYIFTGDGCPHCAKAKEWFKSIEEEYGNEFILNEYEVWNNTSNNELMKSVSDYFNDNANGVPYIIVGEERFQGFADDYKKEIISSIENEFKKSDNERFDAIAKVKESIDNNKFQDRRCSKIGDVPSIGDFPDSDAIVTYGNDDSDVLEEEELDFNNIDWENVFSDFDWEDIFSDENVALIGSILAGVLVISLILIGIGLILKLIEIIAFWKVFKKANEPGWAALIPIYDTYVKAKIGGTGWWWIIVIYITNIIGFLGAPLSGGLSMVLPLFALFGKFNVYYNMSKKFNRDAGMAIVLTLFPLIGACVLGFGKSTYNSKVVTSENGVFGSSTPQTATVVVSANYCPSCGEAVKAGDTFCEKCGSKIN